MSQSHRATIALEDARILFHDAYEGGQHIMRVAAPRIAASAHPGAFVHLRCAQRLPMRRPISIMRADPEAGWIDLLYKTVGRGTRALAGLAAGTELSVLGPIGQGFTLPHGRLDDASAPLALFVGGGVGIPPVVFAAERAAQHFAKALVLMGSEVPFPFAVTRSARPVAGVPASVDRVMPLLESLGVPSRLASLAGYAGVFEGYVTDLARPWLEALQPDERERVTVYACGPTPMLRATAALAAELDVACEVCLEEFMACAVGGCAGCAVKIRTTMEPPPGATVPLTASEYAMRRVCVDGPVFDARSVVW